MASIQLRARAEPDFSPETPAAMRDSVSPFCTRCVSDSPVAGLLDAECRAGGGSGSAAEGEAALSAAAEAGSLAAAGAAAVAEAAAVLRSTVPSRVPVPVAGATGALATCD